MVVFSFVIGFSVRDNIKINVLQLFLMEKGVIIMPLHLYIDNYFQKNIHARQQGVTIEILPLEKLPKVEKVENEVIDIGSTKMPIRIYTPDPLEKEEKHYPLLIFFHGGHFIQGGIESHDVSCRLLSSLSGYKVIAVDYFLNQQLASTFNDCYTMTKWVFENAHELEGKQSDIAIAGASLGATIATIITFHSIKTSEFKLKKQVLYYPLIDVKDEIEQSKFQSRKLYNGKYGLDITYGNSIEPSLTVLPLFEERSLLGEMPGTLLFTAEYDPLCDEGELYAEQLNQAGTNVKHVHFDGNIHGFMQYFPGSPDYMRGYQMTSEFLN